MELLAHCLGPGTTLQADVCVVGAGPVGLALATELSRSELTTLLVETGSWCDDPTTLPLVDGRVEGDPSAVLRSTRARRIGGTSALWNTPIGARDGAKFVPVDSVDFRALHGRPPWPFPWQALDPYYPRAHLVAGLGRFDYDPENWRLPASPIPATHPTFAAGLFHLGAADRFLVEIPGMLRRCSQVTICHGLTVTGFRWRADAVEEISARRLGGPTIKIRAKYVVLAGGGIENARLLLLEQVRGNWRDQSGWLGRGYMEHPRDYTLSIGSRSPDLVDRLEFFDAHQVGGAAVCGRLAIRGEAVERLDLPNASVTFLPTPSLGAPVHWRLAALARRLGVATRWPPLRQWSKVRRDRRRFDGFQLLINVEEFPHAENRVSLDAEVDGLGLPRPLLTRRWRADDQKRLDRLHTAIAEGLEELGLGPIVWTHRVAPDPNSHHYLGTTRMAHTPAAGVADPDGRVFSTTNLFVAGASLFPTGGFANPTLTAIALAIRLSDALIALR